MNEYLKLLSKINFEYWLTKNPYFSDETINPSMKKILKQIHSAGYLKNFKPSKASDYVNKIEYEIENFNFNQPNFNNLSDIFDLIQAWGGWMGRLPYVGQKKSRLNFDNWKQDYLEGSMFCKKNKPIDALKKWLSIDYIGMSFATKHIRFWSNEYPILDARMNLILCGNKNLLRVAENYETYLNLIQELASIYKSNILETEKAIFAFNQNFFENDKLVLYGDILDQTDSDVAKKYHYCINRVSRK